MWRVSPLLELMEHGRHDLLQNNQRYGCLVDYTSKYASLEHLLWLGLGALSDSGSLDAEVSDR